MSRVKTVTDDDGDVWTGKVVDVDHHIADAFHVPLLKDAFASRQSFLIGEDGRIQKIWLDVDPQAHAAEVIAAAKS